LLSLPFLCSTLPYDLKPTYENVSRHQFVPLFPFVPFSLFVCFVFSLPAEPTWLQLALKIFRLDRYNERE
ncbi:MAG: hypothetical protein L0220_34740, partial [Acidobacteria bacterium]|nr:hypothetical protein [Acidobacteriota bacterium]